MIFGVVVEYLYRTTKNDVKSDKTTLDDLFFFRSLYNYQSPPILCTTKKNNIMNGPQKILCHQLFLIIFNVLLKSKDPSLNFVKPAKIFIK